MEIDRDAFRGVNEAHDLKKKASERPNLAISATWVFVSILLVVVFLSAFITG